MDEIGGDGKSAVPLRQKCFDTTVSFFPIPAEITTSSFLPCLFPFILLIFGLCRSVYTGYPTSALREKEELGRLVLLFSETLPIPHQ